MKKYSRLIPFGALFAFAGIAFASTTSVLLPTSDGTYAQWTPSTGTSHFALVDETVCNGTTDYNSTGTVGNRDSYGVSLASVPNAGQITKIEIVPCASGNSAIVSATMNVFYRLNGANSADAGAYSLSGTTPVPLATTSFSGLSTIKSPSTTLESGAVLSASTLMGARLSRLATVVTYTALAAPTGVTATASSSSQINLTWLDNSSFESNYVIERRNVTASTTFATIATTTANSTSYNDTGLTSSTVYNYRVRAYDVGGYSAYSSTAAATTSALSAPSSLVATATTSSQVGLTWFDNSSDESNYVIERKATMTGTYATIATTSANVTAYLDTGLSSLTGYTYRVRAYDLGGYSSFSNSSSATTTALAAPSSLVAIASSSSQINLTWLDNSSFESNYVIERRNVTASTTFATIATTTANTTSYQDFGLASSTTYGYRVRAYDTGGYSAYSNTSATSTKP